MHDSSRLALQPTLAWHTVDEGVIEGFMQQ